MSVTTSGGRCLRQLYRMTLPERRLLTEAWVLSLVVVSLLRWVSFDRLIRWVDRPTRVGRRSLPTRVTPLHAARLVRSAGARIGWSTCLTRAVVLKLLLARRGIDTELVIGATRQAGSFEAHAWLRLGDEVVLGGEGHRRFVPLWTRSRTTEGALP